MSARDQERKRQFRRTAFHAAVAVILILCVIAPFLETAAHWDNTIFATGYDGESTVALLMILLELVISFTGLLTVYFCCKLSMGERLVPIHSPAESASNFLVRIPELSAPPPLRI